MPSPKIVVIPYGVGAEEGEEKGAEIYSSAPKTEIVRRYFSKGFQVFCQSPL